MTDKPNAPACQRNREPILEVLRERLAHCHKVLEIGSGTGQHAVHFAAALPHLLWQCSDRAENLPGIRAWIDDAGLLNTPPPIELDVTSFDSAMKQRQHYDAVFSANTLHIMGWREVQAMFALIADVLAEDATVVIYGPFNVGGHFTSPSNARFDADLKARGAHMGLRDLEAVDALARAIGLHQLVDIPMPANNRCLAWRRSVSL